MLGVVDGLIQQHLRSRVIDDIGDPQMDKKCLDLIDRLKLDADTLTAEEQKTTRKLKFNQENWTIRIDAGEDSGEEKDEEELDVEAAPIE